MDLSSYQWSVFCGEDVVLEYLKSVCAFRSEILFDNGFRPYFGPSGPLYGDYCADDLKSFHVVATQNDQIAGVVRIAPPGTRKVAERVLGRGGFQQLLQKVGAQAEHVLEINRLAVAKEHRKQGLGQVLMHAAFAFVRFEFDLNEITVIGSAGNCTRQAQFFLKHTDYVQVEDFPTVFSQDFNDDITFLVYPNEPAGRGAENMSYFGSYFERVYAKDSISI